MLTKNDFVEIEYTARIKETNEVFDTNLKEEAKKLNLEIETKPLIICLGQNMILKAIDEFLIGKEENKNYRLELEPEKAFGFRNKELIKIMPLSVFAKHDVKPEPGMVFSFDNLIGKVSVVSGGRVIVDFNNPMAGKAIVYELKIKRKVTDEKEKIKALMLAFFRKEFPFKLENNKLIIDTSEEFKKFIEFFKGKFKEILNLDLEVQEKSPTETKEESKEEKIST